MDPQPQTKRLYRSRTNKVFAGVCGGLGEYFDIDPLIFRILFLILLLGGGAGFWIYLVLMIAVPKAPLDGQPAEPLHSAKDFADEVRQGANSVAQEIRNTAQGSGLSDRRTAIGAIIVVVGIIALLNQIMPFSIFRWDWFWPAILILIGIAIITKHN